LSYTKFQELILRWFQFDAFCPILRFHGKHYPHSPNSQQNHRNY